MATGSMYMNKIATRNIVDKMTDGNIYMNKMNAFKVVCRQDDQRQYVREENVRPQYVHGQNGMWLKLELRQQGLSVSNPIKYSWPE